MNKEQIINTLKTLKHRGIAKSLPELEKLYGHQDFYLALMATVMEGKDISAIEKIEALRTIEYIFRQDKQFRTDSPDLLLSICNWRESLVPKTKAKINIKVYDHENLAQQNSLVNLLINLIENATIEIDYK